MPGAIASLLVIGLVVIYASLKCNDMVNKLDPTVTKQSFFYNLATESAYNPFEQNFALAFGVGSYLDPSIGYYTVNHISYEYSNVTLANGSKRRDKIKTPV